MEEISNVTGGLRLLQALAAAEAANAEAVPGPEARVDLDVLWIFIGKVRRPQTACASSTVILHARHGRPNLCSCRNTSGTAQWGILYIHFQHGW